MISKTKRSVSVWFFAAFVLSCIFIGATVQNNREIEQRRLIEPVQTVGTLVSSRCTTWMRGAKSAGPKPEIVLEYRYPTIGFMSVEHVFVTTKWFDTMEACFEFEKSNSRTSTIWYEKSRPEKASLYEAEPYSWGFLYGLILAALFVVFGVYDQKSINQEKRGAQKKNRASNRLKREEKS
jgi:uncharacterized membrane protein